jgi:hypothetical protein
MDEGYHTAAELGLNVRRGIKPAYRRYEVTALYSLLFDTTYPIYSVVSTNGTRKKR